MRRRWLRHRRWRRWRHGWQCWWTVLHWRIDRSHNDYDECVYVLVRLILVAGILSLGHKTEEASTQIPDNQHKNWIIVCFGSIEWKAKTYTNCLFLFFYFFFFDVGRTRKISICRCTHTHTLHSIYYYLFLIALFCFFFSCFSYSFSFVDVILFFIFFYLFLKFLCFVVVSSLISCVKKLWRCDVVFCDIFFLSFNFVFHYIIRSFSLHSICWLVLRYCCCCCCCCFDDCYCWMHRPTTQICSRTHWLCANTHTMLPHVPHLLLTAQCSLTKQSRSSSCSMYGST